ncbi:MAG: PKD domain-containing protein, partial [Nocardioidaceae bacterium]
LHVEYSAGPVSNRAPTVDAGVDRSVVLPNAVSLDGTVTDDGLPAPPNVSTTWTESSGPGNVTFGNPSAVDTTATFSSQGDYVLRLTAADGELTALDEVAVSVLPAGTSQTFEVRVATSSDDAEQAISGSTALDSSDLELVTDGNTQQIVGTRFTGVQIPQGATITNAYIQFRTDEVSTDVANLTLRAEAHDNTPTYAAVSGNLANRATTTANVAWTPPAWNTVNEAGVGQRTPNIASLVQAIVNRAGWSQGNALAIQVRGTGRRTADAFESGATFAPLLHVEWSQ